MKRNGVNQLPVTQGPRVRSATGMTTDQAKTSITRLGVNVRAGRTNDSLRVISAGRQPCELRPE